MVVIDDVHWAAPTLLELMEHLVETVEDGPILLLCTARPDMLEMHPSWSDGPGARRLTLDRLPDAATERVIENLLDGVRLPDAVRDIVVRSAEGNPLFVEQLVSMLIERGALVKDRGGWRAATDLARLEIPPSIQALLTARLDRLSLEERGVAEPAAVVGLEFPSTAIRDLVPAEAREGVDEQLRQLVRRQLVRQTPPGEREFGDHRFHHLLIRDAAYQRILKRGRAELHARFADWLERFDATHGRPGEHDEVVGYHLEQAVVHREQLGPVDVHVRVLAARAAEKLAAAGRRAFVRGDLPAAASLLGRAAALLPEHDAVRLALLPDIAETLMETGAFDQAADVLRGAREPEARAANAAEVARGGLVGLLVDLYAGSDESWAERVEAEIATATPIFEAAGHHAGLATAARLRYLLDGSALRFDAAARAAEEIIEHAERAGDVRQQRRGALGYAMAALHGPTPVDEAITRCEQLIDTVDGDRRTQAAIQLCLAQLLAMRGEFGRARSLATGARRMLEELGASVLAASTSTDTAQIELLAGDPAAAEARLRADLAALEAMGESYLRSTVAGMLARVLVREGPSDEAERLVTGVRELAAPDDVDAQVLWRSALARQRAHGGAIAEAMRLADEAVALSTATSAPVLSAQSLTDRALVLQVAGRDAEAAADLARAKELYRVKGNTVAAAAIATLTLGGPVSA
jgi:predicted ATPase